jgi:hypothetical protein
VLGIYEQRTSDEMKRIKTRASIDAYRRQRAEFENVRVSGNLMAIQAAVVSAGAFGAIVAKAYVAYSAAEGAVVVQQECSKGVDACATIMVPALIGAISPVDPPSFKRHSIAKHREQIRPKGHRSHHPEQQTALRRALGPEQYNPEHDYTILLHQETEHQGTYSPQARQRQDPQYVQKLGGAEALGQAFVMLRNVGVPADAALELILKHSGYLFEASQRRKRSR